MGSEWWFTKETLTKLAHSSVVYPEGENQEEEEEEQEAIEEMVTAHLGAPKDLLVPARFLALLDKWNELRDSWITDVTDKMRIFQAGIDKLEEAAQRVSKLEEDATKQRQELEVGTLSGQEREVSRYNSNN